MHSQAPGVIVRTTWVRSMLFNPLSTNMIVFGTVMTITKLMLGVSDHRFGVRDAREHQLTQ